jgi:membrane associated rhomboid family serine protease
MLARDNISLGLPPFRGAIRAIILASAAVYVGILLALSFAPATGQLILRLGMLDPALVGQGAIWQFLTYAFVHVDPLQFVLSMLGVYFIGGAVEQQIGPRRLLRLYFFSAIVSGVLGCALSLTGVLGEGPAFTAGAAANGLLMVFYLLNRGAPIFLFPLPIPIPVKYVVMAIAALEAAYLLLSHFALFYLALLLGLGSGYAWHRLATRRGIAGFVEGGWLDLRGAYYRWKRRRAAKQFEVYMRKHGGTYVDPMAEDHDPRDKAPRKKNGEPREPWIH